MARRKKIKTTDVEYKRMALKERINKLVENGKNIKSQGVIRKLIRKETKLIAKN
jgi:hypothetical protein